MSFLKATRGQIVIPYVDTATDRRQRFIFIPAESGIDLIPVRLKGLRDISMLVREIETGTKPDHIVVSGSVTRNDIIIIKNRLAGAHIILAGGKSEDGATPREESEINSFGDQRATEVAKDLNINMMSNNPFSSRAFISGDGYLKVNRSSRFRPLTIERNTPQLYNHHAVQRATRRISARTPPSRAYSARFILHHLSVKRSRGTDHDRRH